MKKIIYPILLLGMFWGGSIAFALSDACGYIIDTNTVTYCGTVIDGADPESFEAFTSGWEYAKDKNHAYFRNLVIDSANPSSFEIIDNIKSKDDNNVYCKDSILTSDVDNFAVVEEYATGYSNLSWDSSTMYYGCDEIVGSDPDTFAPMFDQDRCSTGFGEDASHIYFESKVINVDLDSFELFGSCSTYSKDANTVFFESEALIEADIGSFKIINTMGRELEDPLFGECGSLAIDYDAYDDAICYLKGEVVVNRNGQSTQEEQQVNSYFSDIEKDSLNYMYRHGIIDGYPDGTFGPQNNINRAELLKMIMDASYKEVVTPEENCFPDVPKDEWYAPYVCTAYKNGWVQGYPDATFKPAQNINKVETLKIIAEVQGWDFVDDYSSNETSFTDLDKNSWYYKYVIVAEDHVFVDEGDNFNPAQYITREEVAEILFRTIIEAKLGHIETEANNMMDRTLPAMSRDFFAFEDGALSVTYDQVVDAATKAEEEAYFFGNNEMGEPINEYKNIQVEKEDGTVYAILKTPFVGEDAESAACPHFCIDTWMLAKFDKNKELVAFDWTGLTLQNNYLTEWNLLSADNNEALVEEWSASWGSSSWQKNDSYTVRFEDSR